MLKKIGFIFVTLVLVIMLMGCSSTTTTSTTPPVSTTTTPTSTTPTTTLAPIKIGHIVDLTGIAAMIGKAEQTALQLAFDAINNQIAGHPVQIIVGDAAGDAATAVDVARKMVEQDKVVAILGPTQVGEKFSVAGYLGQVGIPMITYNPTPLNLFLGSSVNKWVIGTGGSDVQEPTCMADYLYNHLHYKTITTLSQDNSGGRAFLNPLIDAFKAAGGQVVQSQWVPVPCPDFSVYFTNLKSADALVTWDGGSDAILLLTQFHQMGLDKKMALVGAFHGDLLDSHIVSALPADVAASVVGDITIMNYAPDSQDAANQAFVKAFTAKMNFPPGDDGTAGPYQAAQVLIQALNATKGDTTPNTLLAALAKVNLTGPMGPLSFAAGTTCATMNMYIVKVTQFGPSAYGYTTVYTYPNVPPTGFVQSK